MPQRGHQRDQFPGRQRPIAPQLLHPRHPRSILRRELLHDLPARRHPHPHRRPHLHVAHDLPPPQLPPAVRPAQDLGHIVDVSHLLRHELAEPRRPDPRGIPRHLEGLVRSLRHLQLHELPRGRLERERRRSRRGRGAVGAARGAPQRSVAVLPMLSEPSRRRRLGPRGRAQASGRRGVDAVPGVRDAVRLPEAAAHGDVVPAEGAAVSGAAVRAGESVRSGRRRRGGRGWGRGHDGLPNPPVLHRDLGERVGVPGLQRAAQVLPRRAGRLVLVPALSQILVHQGVSALEAEKRILPPGFTAHASPNLATLPPPRRRVVFMTFWQGIAISLLASTTDVLGVAGEKVSVGKGDMDEEDQAEVLAKQAQNFLICIEMLGFSIAHFYCFPVEEWEEGYRPVEDKGKFGDNMALGDFLHDLKLIMRHKERRKRAAKEKSGSKPMSDDSISTVLEEDEELGGSDSNDGLRSLLVDVEGLLEGEDVDGPSASRRREDSSTAGADPGADHQQQPTPRTLYRKSVQESLRAMDAPRELRAATALLLQSTLLDEDTARLLTSDILEQPLEPEARGDDKGGGAERTGGEDASPYEVEQKLPPEDSDDRESAAEEEPLSNHEPSTGENATTSGETAEPSESTSLLMAPSKNDDMLRPSIFTMHSTSPPDA
ncbi:hypothetical protein ACHAWF_013083 [Thalassiosira exigua]